jgi:N-acetylglucosaminyl-diphospho-decaprenol L-rhamnosyltransferase
MTGEAHEATDVHIVVVNTDNRPFLEKCLKSVKVGAAGLNVRATVVDNASTDGSSNMVRLRFPWADVIDSKIRIGYPAALNLALAPVVDARSSRFVLLMNEDVELGSGSVQAMVERAGQPTIGAVGPVMQIPEGGVDRTFYPFPTVLSEVVQSIYPRSAREWPNRTAEGWLHGGCVLVKVDALRDIGGRLDERFFLSFDDTDLARRLDDAGWKSELCNEAWVFHDRHQSVGRPTETPTMEFQRLRSRYLYFLKHEGRFRAEFVAAAVRVGLGIRAAKALAVGRTTRNHAEAAHGTMLLSLAGYSPRHVLPHEAQLR